jgi:hypothetical protein
MAYVPNNYARFGATYNDLCLNGLFRGTFGTPPAVVYLSLGAGAWGSVTEIPGIRAALTLDRGSVRGANPTRTIHQSVLANGGALDACYFGYEVTGHIDKAQAETTVGFVMVWDAATGGNLLATFIANPTDGTRYVLGGDVFRFSANMSMATHSGSAVEGGNIYQMLTDWLYRGYPLASSLSLGSYPNVYLNVPIASFPNPVVLPRGAGSWSAPSDAGIAGSTARKIVNAAAVDFGPATSAGSTTTVVVQAFPTASMQSYERLFYGSVVKALGSYSWGVGDTLRFAAGDLEIVWG